MPTHDIFKESCNHQKYIILCYIIVIMVILFAGCFRKVESLDTNSISNEITTNSIYQTETRKEAPPQEKQGENQIEFPYIISADMFEDYQNPGFSSGYLIDNQNIVLELSEKIQEEERIQYQDHIIIYHMNNKTYDVLDIPDFLEDKSLTGASINHNQLVLCYIQYGFLYYENNQLVKQRPFHIEAGLGGITDVKNQIRYFVDSDSIMKDTESGIQKVLDIPNLKQKESPYMVRVSASRDKIMSLVLRYEGAATGVCLADLKTQDIQIIEKDLSYPELAYNREIPVVFYPLDVERGVDIYYGDTLEKTLRFLPEGDITSIYIHTYTIEPEDPYILCQYSEDVSQDEMILFDFAAEQYAVIQSDKEDTSIKGADLSDDAKLVLSVESGEPDRIVIRELEQYPFHEFPQEWRPAV